MKKYISIPLTLLTVSILLLSATNQNEKPPALMIGDRAPSFTANSTQGEINFPEGYWDKWKIA